MNEGQRKELLLTRREIGKKLSKLLAEQGSPFTLDDIKAAIDNEEGTSVFGTILRMFRTEPYTPEFQILVDLIREAWNYYPHKSLGGLSPKEKAFE